MDNNAYKIYLNENEMPRAWYNLRADMKNKPEPLLNPGTHKPVTEDELSNIFCSELSKQEIDNDTAYFEIPQEIREYYKTYRPSPLVRARNLEKALNTPAKIYFKFEGNNTSGSHKLNSAVAQAYYAKKQGITKLTTETGAGQWGTALAQACAYFGIDLTVFMVSASYRQKPFRKAIIETLGGKVIASPSNVTNAGRKLLEDENNINGSLGTAISEAVEVATTTDSCRYVLGSVLNQVLLHQSIIGLECETAFNKIGEYPDIIIGCAGGGSNLGGLISPFMRDKITKGKHIEFIAVEPASCPSLTRGKYVYDFCDTGKITPLAKMYTLGCGFIPSASHSGGLRYHGMSPVISQLYADGLLNAVSLKQTDVFKAAVEFARIEGILPAPESAHAICQAINEANKCKKTGEEKTIFFGLTGTGYFDMTAYSAFLNNTMDDYIPTDEQIEKSLSGTGK